MRIWPRLVWVLAAVLTVVAFPASGAPGAGEEPPARLVLDVTGWQRTAAPLPDAGDGIGPGSYLLITIDAENDEDDGTFICSANYVWRSSTTTYLGAAGHCFLPPSEEKAIGSNAWVTRVEVCRRFCAFGGQLGAVVNGEFADLGPVVYARQHAQGDDSRQIGYDFGLVTVPSSLSSILRSAMPVWGGPTAVANRTGAVCMYGNGFLTGEVFASKARIGIKGVRVFHEDGWEAEVPINGGDSGSAINMCDTTAGGLVGTDALGLVTHGLGVGIVPTAMGFGTTIAEAKAMVLADWNRSIEVVLASTTTPPTPETNTAPSASFTTSCSGASCRFDGSASSDPDGTVTNHAWDFGDGSTGNGAVVSHRFGGSSDTTYAVTLTVRDDDGASASATDTVTCTGKGKNRKCSA